MEEVADTKQLTVLHIVLSEDLVHARAAYCTGSFRRLALAVLALHDNNFDILHFAILCLALHAIARIFFLVCHTLLLVLRHAPIMGSHGFMTAQSEER
jgi:hypothetical protein